MAKALSSPVRTHSRTRVSTARASSLLAAAASACARSRMSPRSSPGPSSPSCTTQLATGARHGTCSGRPSLLRSATIV
eukprot:scaffold1669_cov108-Isochrysis_galbana.AAC.14